MVVLYKDNPKLKQKVIETVSGRKEYRRNCKYIKGVFYVKDEDCFYIEEKDLWYRKDSGLIEYNHEKNVWVLRNSLHLIHGVIGFNKEEVAEFGYFTPNVFNNCKIAVYNKGTYICINVALCEVTTNWFEDISSTIWYHKDQVGGAYNKMIKIRNEREGNFNHKGYNIEDNVIEFALKKTNYTLYKPKIHKEVYTYANLLGDLTFGMECETSMGNTPDRIQHKLGLVACRDGSITSAEWVTVPMEGARGLYNIKQVGIELSKRCNIDIGCSLHYHFGNVPTSRLYMVAIYTLAYKIQDEVFKMFPYYKTDPRGVKRKNYCQKLKKMGIHNLKDTSKEGFEEYINNVYDKLFLFLSDGHPPGADNNRKRQAHPIRDKWQRHSR